ncbi:MAG: CCA tRNA nucleotidyltransferase [Acidobacteriota bacterium]
MLERKREAVEIVKRLRQHGHQAFLVGGCVRDEVMGRAPKDFDIATSAHPEDVLRLYPQALTVGARFGVVLIEAEGHQYEVTTFRSDGTYRDGRRPEEVTYSEDPRTDVFRRDFTLNGLLCDPLSGEILDFVGGRADIAAGVIRTIGGPEQRFREDKLRLLRAVRFAARFGFKIEPATRAAIRQMSAEILQVSWERSREELSKILTEGYAASGVSLMDECNLLQHLLPEVSALQGVSQPPEFHPEGDVWTHTLLMLELMDRAQQGTAALDERGTVGLNPALVGDLANAYPTITLALGVLLHDIGKPPTFSVSDRIRFNQHADVGARMATVVCERFRLTNRQIQRVFELVRDHLKFKDLPHMRPATAKRFIRQEGFEEHLELHRLDCLGSHRNLDNWKLAWEMMSQLDPTEIRPPRVVTGDDLIRLGHSPGPRFQEILKDLEDAQLDGMIRTREEALAWLKERYPPDRNP